MSALAILFHRNHMPTSADELAPLMAALDGRGPDGRWQTTTGPFALGWGRFWTTPEDVGQLEPPVSRDGRLTLLWDGRLDNRDDLQAALRPNDLAPSDAALALLAYQRWGDDAFARLLGPFVLAVVDHAQSKLTCARDPLGDRALFYYADGRIAVIASEETAVLAHPAVPDDLDQAALAAYFALRPPPDGRTFFAAVRTLPPGGLLTITPDRVAERPFWTPPPVAPRRGLSDDAAAERCRALLDQSVRCRLRAVEGRTAVLMSGGLDSTSVAALAGRALAPQPLPTLSWHFSELAEADERPYIDVFNTHHQTQPLPVPADDEWPLRDLAAYLANPNAPALDPYEGLMARSYDAAPGRVLLTGLCGDHLYLGMEGWLLDLLRDGRYREAAGGWLALGRRFGPRWLLAHPGTRRVPGYLLDRLPGGHRLRPRRPSPLPWLTAEAQALLDGRPLSTNRRDRVLDGRLPPLIAAQTAHAARRGVELRHPYRDRRLIDFFLTLPAHQFYRPFWPKFVMRRAMRGLLPDLVRRRTRITGFRPLFLRGLADRAADRAADLLATPDALWPAFVHRDWLPQHAAALRQRLPQLDERSLVVIWRCLSLELWRRHGRFRPTQPRRTYAPA